MKKQTNKKINKSDKENGIHKRHALVLKTLDALERGMYTGGLDIHWCGDSIGWLWKWKKITKEEMESLCNRVIAYCKGEY